MYEVTHAAIYGALLQEYNVSRIRRLNEERSARIAALKTREDAEAYVAEVRAKIAASFDMPPRPRPEDMNVQIVRTIEEEEYILQCIIYESYPDFPVTAHLILPKNLKAPAPAVLFLCGHSPNGKLAVNYLAGARTLAANGFITLLIDPVAQGERWQFINAPDSNGIGDGSCTREHNMLGKQLWLCDEFLGTWRAHDALCGLDYLLSRPDVDSSRVGVTGCSGGGTMTSFVQALDPRFTMAAPSCYITSWKRNIENELPCDVEQMPPGLLAAGCEMGDLLLAYAPRPIMLLGQKNDFFDPRGLLETYEDCRKVYSLLGAEDNLKYFFAPHDHGYSVEQRFCMYEFFGKYAGLPPASCEPAAPNVPESELYCTPGGQTVNLEGKKLLHDLIVEKLDKFAAERKKLDLPSLRNLLTDKYSLPTAVEVPYCRSLRPAAVNDSRPTLAMYSRFALETEPGILTTLILRENSQWWFHLPEVEEITLYLPHELSAEEMPGIRCSTLLAGVEARGIGAGHSRNCDFYCMDDFYHPYGSDFHYNSIAIMFDSSTLAERLRDVLGAVAFVKSRGIKKIHMAGKGQGAVLAAFAAVLSDDIASVNLIDAPESFDSMARCRVTTWPHALMLRGILKYTDLPDMYDALKSAGKLKNITFVDNIMRTVI